MTVTTGKQHKQRDKRGDRFAPRRSRFDVRQRGPGRTAPVDPREALPMGASGTSPDAFREKFTTALRLALAEDAPTLEIARSRAALLTFRSAAGLSFEAAERARCEAFRAECERQGVEPMTGALHVTAWGDVVDGSTVREARDEDDLRVPRGRALDGDKVRRGGKR